MAGIEGITWEELMALPKPDMVEEKSFQDIYQEVLQVFAAFEPTYELFLHSDPAVKLLQVFSYREYLLRGRINHVGQSNLLALATGTDLDHLAAFYGVLRRESETDDELRERTRLRITAFSTAGPAPAYRYYALTSSPDVKDAVVTSPAPGDVLVSVLSKEGDGTASQELLDTVTAAVTDEEVRVLTDTIYVASADITTVDVDVVLILERGFTQDLIPILEQNFTTAFDNHRAMGRDITLAWITNQLYRTGVYDVQLNSPTANTIIPATGCAVLGTLTFAYGDQDY